MKEWLKLPLIVTVVVIVARILLEELGGPGWLAASMGVVWLGLLVPIYLAWKIAAASMAAPFKTLVIGVALYTVIMRFMVWISYSLAYVFHWSARRFSVEGGGTVGDGVTAFQGLVGIPFLAFIAVSAVSIVVGSIIGAIALALFRRS